LADDAFIFVEMVISGMLQRCWRGFR